MILTDTHSHIYSEEFSQDQDQMMQRAFDAGVQRIFVPAIDSNYAEAMFAIEKKYPENVFLMMGLHPTYVKENFEEELAFVESELNRRKYFAVGEIGIDLFWDKTFLKQQQEAFQRQIQLAKKHKLPINIHCRDAFDEVFEVLESEKAHDLFGIFHCFTGNFQQAQQAISYGMKLGIGGVATFKNGKIDQFLSEIPIKNIVLETDSPYLAPIPHRGKRNESSYVKLVAEKLALIYNLPIEKIAAITTENSKEIFGV
ncbi:YchF/TatD family DNA exonuclease [Flavobacterium sp. NST-5]|uniref:YchF/TatD family DNA exonuclease n=1 Tax=Flavobacterium ichthyis TaxID=2698827 RepID=A0ABW9Z7R0_9FLAO|nr:TatD family hydrolase [Flavobacterium ichthyis]NBL64907.1 YchF/TatD family DNA exonuclease [Flavobacterium ichthyis]